MDYKEVMRSSIITPEESYSKGFNDGRESVHELLKEAFKMQAQVNYKYIVVTQEKYDRLKETGKLV